MQLNRKIKAYVEKDINKLREIQKELKREIREGKLEYTWKIEEKV